jgi:hypothetical protein
MLVGVNVDASWLVEEACVLNCKIEHIPFLYLGLSLDGRLVLLKYILSSLSVYFLSFFKAPTSIISSIKSIFNCFFLRKVRMLGKFHG